MVLALLTILHQGWKKLSNYITRGNNMSLQYQVETVPEGLEEFYEASEGKFVLKIDGLPQPKDPSDELKAKVEEFRSTNISLKRQLEEFQGKVGVADEAVAEQVKKAVAANNEKVAAAEAAAQKYEALLQKVVLADKVKEAAIKYGVADTAVQDVMNRAEQAFIVKDGVPLPKGGEVDANGAMLSPETWIKALSVSAPHLFKASVGSGAKRSGAAGNNNQELSGRDLIAAGLANRTKR